MTNKKFAFIERAIRRSLNETNEINRVETEQDAFEIIDAAIDENQRSKLYKAVNAKSSYAFDKLYLMSDRLGAEHQHFADLAYHISNGDVANTQNALQNHLNHFLAVDEFKEFWDGHGNDILSYLAVKTEDVFQVASDKELNKIVRYNKNFRKWFGLDDIKSSNEYNKLENKVVMNGKMPRLFYRGIAIGDNEEQEIETQGRNSSYHGDYFASNPRVAATYPDMYENPKVFSGFLRPCENPFIIPCELDVESDRDNAWWSNVLENYNIYQAVCLFDKAGFEMPYEYGEWTNGYQQGDFDDAYNGRKITHTETYYYTDAEINDDGEFEDGAVRCFQFFTLNQNDEVTQHLIFVNADYQEKDFVHADGKIPYFNEAFRIERFTTNDFCSNIQAYGEHDGVFFLDLQDMSGNLLDVDEIVWIADRKSIIANIWGFERYREQKDYEKAYFKEIRNNGEFNPDDNRIFYSLFDIEQDSKQKMETTENQQLSGSLNVSPEQEFSATAERLGGEDAYKQAKESGKTALTYKQWVQVRTPSFKAWFGDWENDPENASKVIHPDTGEPLVVYHGSNNNDFTIFDKKKINPKGLVKGFFFAPEKRRDSVAGYYGKGKERPFFLNIKNPFITNPNNRENYKNTNDGIISLYEGNKKIDKFFNWRTDKVEEITMEKGDIVEIIVFNPEQIKSATDNIGTFNAKNPDIRFDVFRLPENDFVAMQRDLRIAKVLQGEPVCVLNERLAPHKGTKELKIWANQLFNKWGNKAVSPELGEIVFNHHSVNDSVAHGLNPYKAEAFRSIKDVIEQGVVVTSTQVGRENHFFIAAPVTIENKEDIVTVLVKQDMNTQRMYLHSVLTKESILNKDFGQKSTPEHLVRSADTEVSEPNRKLYSGDVGRILQNYLKVNIPQLEKEVKAMENQQLSGNLNNSTVIASEQSERGNPQTTESETPTTGNLNNQEIATTATQSRNDGVNSGSLNDTPFSINERQAWNEFFDDRDNRAFTARWNMQRMLPEQLGDAAYQHLSVETLRQAYIEHPDVFDKINEDAKVSGFYISDENKVVLIADSFIGREQTAVFTAWHELAHRGIAVQGRELWDDWLQTARKNDTVKEIADRIQIVYEHQGTQLNDLQATEEAVAEIFAAYKTQEWETLEQRHQIELSHEFKKPLGTAARLWHSAKNRIGKIFGVSQENRQPEQPKITDEQLFAMLGKLEQSIYQQPEFAVHERLAMGEAFTNYYDLNNQWKQLDLFETLTTTDFANGIDDNHLSGSLTTTRGADTVIASENPTVIASEQSERGNLLLKSKTELNGKLIAKIKAAYPDETNRSIRQKLGIWIDDNENFLENGFEKTKELFPKAFSGSLNDKNTVKSEPQSERGNLTTTENELSGNLKTEQGLPNLSLWIAENAFEFESKNDKREVFQKDNLKLGVLYSEDEDDGYFYFVSLSQFGKNIPIAEIDEKHIEATRQERFSFFEDKANELEKLSQYLREMEQGIGVSATSENSQERQPEPLRMERDNPVKSERGNSTTENDISGSLNIKNSKTTPLSKEQKAQLKAAKDAVSTLKKELNSLRSNHFSKVGYVFFNETESRYRIIHAQRNLHEAERIYNRLYLDFHSQTGEMTDVEKQIFNARLSGKLSERVAIVLPELKAQKDELRQEYDALSDRIRRLDFDEFEIQGAMQDAIEHFNEHHYRILRHNGKDLPHSTDREKAIAYLAKVVMPEQLNQIATPHDSLVRKINQLSRRETYTPDEMADRYQVRFLSVLETAENQLIKGSIEARAEINLTYDINTPDGEQKVRELFYKNPHDSEQAELFEKVFAMAQKLNVEVRHALTDKYVNIDTRNYLGVYLYTQNSARVKHNGRIKPEQKGEVLLHELVHAVSSRAMVLKEQGHTELLNPAQIQAIDEIEKIFKSVWDKAEALGLEKYSHQKGDYGLKNSHEMLAELANPEFRDKLKQIGVFDDTVAKITEISTGVGQAETVYDRLTKALYQLMDNYDPDFGEKYDKAKIRNIQMFDIKEENHMQEELLNQLDSQDATIRRGEPMSEDEIRNDCQTALASFDDVYDLSHAVDYGLNNEDVAQLAHLHQTQPELRSKIEDLLEDVNFHTERQDFENGVYDKYRQPEPLRMERDNPVQSEQQSEVAAQREVAADKGGVSIPHANLFLSATKALLYRDLENAVRWHNHFIEESKEIPVPQAVIDIQTKRIEEYSKRLNKYLYGNEHQKYRDMFPEQIEKIKQDFKKMQDLKEPTAQQGGFSSPENTVKQDAFGLPETQMKIDENRFYEITQEKGLVNFIDENVQNGTYEKMPLSMIKLEMKAGLENLAHWVEYEIDEYYGFYAGTSPDEFEELHKNYTKEERENFVLSHEKEHAKSVHKRLDEYNQAAEKVANYFGIEQSQVAEFLGYEEPKETLEQARQIISGSPKEQTALQGGISSPENTVKFDDFGVSENGNAMKIDTSLPFEEQYQQYQLAEERISRQSTEASVAVQYLQGQKGISGFNPERLEKAIAEESRLAKQLDDLQQANPEFALMARAKHLDPKDMTPELRSKLERVSEWVAEKNTVKYDFNTPETLTPQEQALKDGKQLLEATKRVEDTFWQLQKQPDNPERKQQYQDAQLQYEQLENQIRPRVQEAIAKGEAYICLYDKKDPSMPYEMVINAQDKLRIIASTVSNPDPDNLDNGKNVVFFDYDTSEILLNAEQRSSNERIAEVLRWNFDINPTAMNKMIVLNHPNASDVFSEDEIRTTLNRGIQDKNLEICQIACKSHHMKNEWLQAVVEKHSNPAVVQLANSVLETRQSISGRLDTSQNEISTANHGGVSISAGKSTSVKAIKSAKTISLD